MNLDITNKVSVIIPVYKAEKSIQRCIESLLSQTYPNVEVILVDDGSPDRSGEICDQYTSDQRVIVIHNENKGVSHARNVGLDNATGTYITFCDADDYYSPDHIKKSLQAAIANKSDITISGYFIEIDKGKFISSINGVSRRISSDEVIKHCTIDNEFGGFCWNKLYRADLIKSIRFPEDMDMLEDTYFLFSALKRAKKMYYLATPLYYYCNNKDSAVRNMNNLFSEKKTLKYNDSWKKILANFDLADNNLIYATIFEFALIYKIKYLENSKIKNKSLINNLNHDLKHYAIKAYSCKDIPLKRKIKWTLKLVILKDI